MPAKKLAPAAKPTYAVMVSESIKALGDRTGSSVQAITKQVQAHYRIDINKPALVKAIKKGVQSGTFVQIKASYKLNKKPSSAVVIKSKKSVVPIKKKAPSTSSKSVKKVCFIFFMFLMCFSNGCVCAFVEGSRAA